MAAGAVGDKVCGEHGLCRVAQCVPGVRAGEEHGDAGADGGAVGARAGVGGVFGGVGKVWGVAGFCGVVGVCALISAKTHTSSPLQKRRQLKTLHAPRVRMLPRRTPFTRTRAAPRRKKSPPALFTRFHALLPRKLPRHARCTLPLPGYPLARPRRAFRTHDPHAALPRLRHGPRRARPALLHTRDPRLVRRGALRAREAVGALGISRRLRIRPRGTLVAVRHDDIPRGLRIRPRRARHAGFGGRAPRHVRVGPRRAGRAVRAAAQPRRRRVRPHRTRLARVGAGSPRLARKRPRGAVHAGFDRDLWPRNKTSHLRQR